MGIKCELVYGKYLMPSTDFLASLPHTFRLLYRKIVSSASPCPCFCKDSFVVLTYLNHSQTGMEQMQKQMLKLTQVA